MLPYIATGSVATASEQNEWKSQTKLLILPLSRQRHKAFEPLVRWLQWQPCLSHRAGKVMSPLCCSRLAFELRCHHKYILNTELLFCKHRETYDQLNTE